MAYDKDWEVHLALEDPTDLIHDHIAKKLEDEYLEDFLEGDKEKVEDGET